MNITTEHKNSLELNIQSPSSSLVPLNIHNFVKDIDVSIDTKIETTTSNTTTGGGTQTNTNTGGILGFFKSFFKGFSTLQKSHTNEKDPYLNKMFSSGNINVIQPPQSTGLQKDDSSREDKQTNSLIEDKNIESSREEDKNIESSREEEEEEDFDLDNQEITKITLTTEDPNIILNESLKGTKLFYFAQRTEVPSQWV
jgi:hypothetical protein